MKIDFIQTSGRKFEKGIPLDWCEDFSVETEDGLFKCVNTHKVVLTMSTFGFDHYYLTASLSIQLRKGNCYRAGCVRDKDGNKVDYPQPLHLEICRPVTEAEIKADPDRWRGYHTGSLTNAFWRVEDIKEAIEEVKTWFPGYEFEITQ